MNKIEYDFKESELWNDLVFYNNKTNHGNLENKRLILQKLKEKKKTISITSVVTITGLLNITDVVKVTNIKELLQPVDKTIFQKNNFYIQMNALREYIFLKNNSFQIEEMDRLIITLLKESKNLKLPNSAKINYKPIEPLILLLAIIETESSFNKFAISSSNARGYMQILPETALWIKNKELLNIPLDEIHSTEVNIMLGVKYLNYLSTQFDDIKWICLAYNAGEANLKRGYYDINYWNKVQKFYIEIDEFLKQYQESKK